MKKLICIGTIVSFVLGIASCIIYANFTNGLYLSLAITFFTTFYHFIMRVIVASAVVLFRMNNTTRDLLPFRLGKKEQKFYGIIKVKEWKKYAPTYGKKSFDIRANSLETVMHNMINAQCGHTIIAVLSFLPLLFSKPLDGFLPFLITSVLAAFFDMQVVIIQRYNRANLSKILRRECYGKKALYR